jgi:hypothetical protein
MWDGKTDINGRVIQDGDLLKFNEKYNLYAEPFTLAAKIVEGKGNWATLDLDYDAWEIIEDTPEKAEQAHEDSINAQVNDRDIEKDVENDTKRRDS